MISSSMYTCSRNQISSHSGIGQMVHQYPASMRQTGTMVAWPPGGNADIQHLENPSGSDQHDLDSYELGHVCIILTYHHLFYQIHRSRFFILDHCPIRINHIKSSANVDKSGNTLRYVLRDTGGGAGKLGSEDSSWFRRLECATRHVRT